MISHMPRNSAAMTAAEFRIARDLLGVSADWLAKELGDLRAHREGGAAGSLSLRTVRRWEQGDVEVPPGVAADMQRLIDTQDAFVDTVIRGLEDDDERKPDGCQWVTSYATDAALTREHPEHPNPSAGWHRAAMGLVRDTLPYVRIYFLGEAGGPS